MQTLDITINIIVYKTESYLAETFLIVAKNLFPFYSNFCVLTNLI